MKPQGIDCRLKKDFSEKNIRFRLEYDACRAEIALLPASAQTNEKLYELEKYKEKYEQLKSDTSIKLQLLDENQVWLDWKEKYSNDFFRSLDEGYEKSIASLP